jgi:hypothetical protein
MMRSVGQQMKMQDEFFATARARERIRRARAMGVEYPWTDDPVYRAWRFCNVFREDDRTTAWFREHVRNHVSGLQAVKATIIFRWFNRVEVGEQITDLLIGTWDTKEARRRLKDVHPIVTGAYIIKGWDGYEKLDGVLKCIDEALAQLDSDEVDSLGWVIRNHWPVRSCRQLEMAWGDLQSIRYMGPFMAYEVVSDLRWTDTLRLAADINTWANPGPGCKRGLGWAYSGNSEVRPPDLLGAMQWLLSMSQDTRNWPSDWPRWEMREVEHWLCEFDKYNRALRGDRMKRRYR